VLCVGWRDFLYAANGVTMDRLQRSVCRGVELLNLIP
jgi:hypothetical protein